MPENDDKSRLAREWYLRGNAFRKQQDFQHALECYMEAMELDVDSPAHEAYRMLMDILEFYNKDAYNP